MKRLVLACALTGSVSVIGIASPVQAAAPSVSIHLHGSHAPWAGKYYWVSFPGAGRVTGVVRGVPGGTAVVLQASTFPFTHGYVKSAQTTTKSGGHYTFTVHPARATRYRVRSAGVTSTVATLYAQARDKLLSQTLCQAGATTCHAHAKFANWYPPNVGKREAAKKNYFYRGLTMGSQAPPPTLYKHTKFTLTHKRVSAQKWVFHISFTFRPGSGFWYVQWATCTRETESSDGFGLPVHTGCGKASVPNRADLLRVLD